MDSKHNPQDDLENNTIDVGTALMSWEAWEFPPHQRSRTWYISAFVIGLVFLIYAVWSANYIFAVIILMMGIILLINGLRKPERVHVHITDLGIVFGNHFYDYKDIKDFAIVYDPPEVKILYIDFNNIFEPLLSIPLEDADPNQVRKTLLPYVLENLEREEETLTDTVRRLYKL
ncbi:FUSC family protein [Candidatus Parcubacteria bacterium]|nr:MAG: FUSC family protein [Candidatus Parcubacteria bacterium]